MLYIELYKKSEELFSLDYLRQSDIKTVVVCPSPSVADNIRDKFFKSNKLWVTGKNNLSVLTVSKFIDDELAKYVKDIEVEGKADLILRLSIIWRKYSADLTYELFMQAFNLFTELRSFTVDFSLIEEILKEFDENVSKVVTFFWKYLDEVELVDEHLSYRKLVMSYDENDTGGLKKKSTSNIIFWGFNHLSAGQVDLVKALGNRNDVYIPFPKDVYKNCESSDWIKWLNVDLLEIEEDEKKSRTCKVCYFTKKRLAESIGCFDRKYLKNEPVDVFLGVKNPSYAQINEIPYNGLFFKSPSNLFLLLLMEITDELRETSFLKKKGKCKTAEVLEKLKEIGKKELKLKPKRVNFRKLKVLDLMIKTIQKWEELSIDNEEMSLFDLRIIKHTTSLNVPRTFSAPLLDENLRGSIKGLEALDGLNSVKTMFCVTSGHKPIKSFGSKYNEKVLKFLKTIGPMQRKGLEFSLIKERIIEALSKEENYLFIEKDLDQHDAGWSEILDAFDDITLLELENNRGVLDNEDYLKSRISPKKQKNFSKSATRLQTYIDCPRLYYFKYVEDITLFPSLNSHLLPYQLGQVQHKVIEKFFETNKRSLGKECLDEKVFGEFVRERLKSFLCKQKVELSKFNFEKALIEVIDFSKNGIEQLLLLEKLDKNMNFSFEQSLIKEGVSGQIDFLLRCDSGFGLLDFKRSSSSIPFLGEVETFEKIQLWFYLAHSDIKVCDLAFFGYLNISEPTKSLVCCNDEALIKKLNEVSFLNDGKIHLWKKELKDYLDEYLDFENDLLKRLSEDKSFLPTPRNSDVCKYCVVSNVCPRRNDI